MAKANFAPFNPELPSFQSQQFSMYSPHEVLNHLFHHLPSGLRQERPELMLLTSGGRILASSQLNTQFLGCLPMEVLGSLLNLVHPEDLGELLSNLQDDHRRPLDLGTISSGPITYYFMTFEPVLARLVTTFYDYHKLQASVFSFCHQGAALNFIIFIDRPPAIQDHAASECLQEVMANSFKFLLNKEGCFVHLSPSSSLIIGYSVFELIGAQLSSLITQPAQLHSWLNSSSSSTSFIHTFLVKKDQSQIYVEITLEWVSIESDMAFITGVLHVPNQLMGDGVFYQLYDFHPSFELHRDDFVEIHTSGPSPFLCPLASATDATNFEDLGFPNIEFPRISPQPPTSALCHTFMKSSSPAESNQDQLVALPMTSFTIAATGATSPKIQTTNPSIPQITSPNPTTTPPRRRLRTESSDSLIRSPSASSSSTSSPPSEDQFQHRPQKRKFKRLPQTYKDRHCLSCGTNTTPEWRKGPRGPKTLCNACGLQFAKVSRGNPAFGIEGEDEELSSKAKKRHKKSRSDVLPLDE